MGDNHAGTIDMLLGRKKPVTKTVQVVLDPQLAERHEAARHARDVAQLRADTDPKNDAAAVGLLEAEQTLDAIRARIEEEGAVVEFEFRGIGRVAYEALVDAHPVTPEQRQLAKKNGWAPVGWNFETFPPALVHACLVSPSVTLEEIQQAWVSPDWNPAELQHLFDAANEVNGQRRTVELGKGL